MFVLAMAMAVVVASAQNTPQDFVNLHNRARAADGVGPVAWDNTVAKFFRKSGIHPSSISNETKPHSQTDPAA
jgi:hypothetical protein